MFQATRFAENPIIYPELDPSIGVNINGPSLIRVPDWVESPLGRYHLYFGHHQGQFIRLAYADDLHGPWRIHASGVLHLDQTACINHIASPDAHIDEDKREIVLYFHGVTSVGQRSFHAVSTDGLNFEASDTILGPFYFRVFVHDGATYAIAKTVVADGGGVLLRSDDGQSPFEQGQDILPRQRHVAVQKQGDRLRIFYSRGEDNPERILMSEMDLSGDWRAWTPGEPVDVLLPEEVYKALICRWSRRGSALSMVACVSSAILLSSRRRDAHISSIRRPVKAGSVWRNGSRRLDWESDQPGLALPSQAEYHSTLHRHSCRTSQSPQKLDPAA